MSESSTSGRRTALAVASALLACVLVACGGETSSGGVQTQPGVYPLILIGLFLVIGGAVASWLMYRKTGATKRTGTRADRGGVTRDRSTGDDVSPGGDARDSSTPEEPGRAYPLRGRSTRHDGDDAADDLRDDDRPHRDTSK
ncbi:hypothetical protein [uncultured Corynebacterium sp.]|uniref:hypothetical protein n=1 Tax=uncultured Corynebacterium sp. TaxID=159447 RepID=UPI0025E44D66|nr:hypothetical protein [uncultured Corynebacterium sp.]